MTLRRSRVAAGLALVVILAATLTPVGGATHGLSMPRELALGDWLLNVALFVPLGASLAATGRPFGRVVLVATALSVAIEACQAFIPGRYPSVLDVVTNVAGAASGVLLLRSAPRWLLPKRTEERALATCATGLAVLLLSATLAAWEPSETESTFYGQWTPELAPYEHYGGRVLSAMIGVEPVPADVHPRSRALAALMHAGAPIRVVALAGPRPRRLADVFSIYDEQRRELLVVGVDGRDLVYRRRTKAAFLGLETPELRVPGIVDVEAGDTMRIEIARSARGYCMSVNASQVCDVGFTPGRGWELLWSLPPLPERALALLDLLWLAGLALPLGYWSSARGAVLGGCFVGVTLVALPSLARMPPLPPMQLAAAVGGLGVGSLLRAYARRRPNAGSRGAAPLEA